MSTTGGAAPDPERQILIVDDEEIVLVALRDTLTQLGHFVCTATNAIEGLELIRQRRFAAAFTDHQMPKLTGLEFLAQVREIQPDASRILITAVLNLSTVISAINRAEVFRFLVKPWHRDDLLEIVASALARHDLLQSEKQALANALKKSDVQDRRLQALTDELARQRKR